MAIHFFVNYLAHFWAIYTKLEDFVNEIRQFASVSNYPEVLVEWKAPKLGLI